MAIVGTWAQGLTEGSKDPLSSEWSSQRLHGLSLHREGEDGARSLVQAQPRRRSGSGLAVGLTDREGLQSARLLRVILLS